MKKIFINLSNHPSNKWSSNQIATAIDMADMGPVVDVPFPNIDPEMSTDDISGLARDIFYKDILNLIAEYDADEVILHVMGEMTFTYNIINLVKNFKGENIVCVASTTKRNVVEKNGIKTSTFEFVQFRKYY